MKKASLVIVFLLFFLDIAFLQAAFIRGKITKIDGNSYILSVGTQLRARRGDFFYVYRIINWRRIKVGILQIKDVYYESSQAIVPFFKIPFFKPKIGDEVEKIDVDKLYLKKLSRDYLRDNIILAEKNDDWSRYFERIIFYLLKYPESLWARYKLARYYLRWGLYGDAYLALKPLVFGKTAWKEEFSPEQWIEALLLKVLLEYQFGSQKKSMKLLGELLKDKHIETRKEVKNSISSQNKKPVYESIFRDDDKKSEDMVTPYNLSERIRRKKVLLLKKAALLLKGFFLDLEGYTSFSKMVLAPLRPDDKLLLNETAQLVRFFPDLKDKMIVFLKKWVLESE